MQASVENKLNVRNGAGTSGIIIIMRASVENKLNVRNGAGTSDII
jgi:hypothetical protein